MLAADQRYGARDALSTRAATASINDGLSCSPCMRQRQFFPDVPGVFNLASDPRPR